MKQNAIKTHFVLHEAVTITGFTKYMLDYLAREGIFTPNSEKRGRRGLRRRYTYADLVLLRALHKICAAKGKIRHLKDALLQFRKEFGPLRPGQKLDSQLFVQGDELCVYTSSEGGRQLRTGQITFSFVIDLSVVAREVAECVVVGARSEGFRLTTEVARQAEEERQRIWAPVKARRAMAASRA